MADSLPPDQESPSPEVPARRGFVCEAAAMLTGGVLVAAPLFAGMAVFVDPLRKRESLVNDPDPPESDNGTAGRWVKVTTTDQLPPDGVPRRFSLTADTEDAWNLFRDQPLGGIYVRRVSSGDEAASFEAITTICPHLGCSVDYDAAKDGFACPCHESLFNLEGQLQYGPSPRPLDQLQVAVLNDNEIWVKYQRFKKGVPDQEVEA